MTSSAPSWRTEHKREKSFGNWTHPVAILNGNSLVEISASASEYVNVTFFFQDKRKIPLRILRSLPRKNKWYKLKMSFRYRNDSSFVVVTVLL